MRILRTDKLAGDSASPRWTGPAAPLSSIAPHDSQSDCFGNHLDEGASHLVALKRALWEMVYVQVVHASLYRRVLRRYFSTFKRHLLGACRRDGKY